jgi:hypothetical protein
MMARYYQLREEHGPSDRVLQEYPLADPDHSGLKVCQLRDPKTVRDAFHKAIDDLREALTHDKLTVRSRRLTARLGRRMRRA